MVGLWVKLLKIRSRSSGILIFAEAGRLRHGRSSTALCDRSGGVVMRRYDFPTARGVDARPAEAQLRNAVGKGRAMVFLQRPWLHRE